MADYLLAFATVAALMAALLFIWHRIAGSTHSKSHLFGRVALVLVLALTATGIVTYRLTKSRSFQLAGELVQRVDTAEKVIALTFDDGPNARYTDQVLEILAEYDAPATFYLTGSECEQDPEALDAIVSAGHELGNHTYSHRRLYFIPEATVVEEVERTDAIFRDAGYDGPITFRMPGCKRLLTTPLYLARNDRTTVTWSLEPDSIAAVASTADGIVEYVTGNARPGSIVLMHVMYDARGTTRDALPRILEELSAEGYRFVTVSELLALR